MKQIIHKARIAIDNNLDIEAINRASSGFITHNNVSASAYPVQTINPTQRQNQENNFRRYKPNNQFRGIKRQYQEIEEPVNMDARGDLRYDVRGNPIDLTKQDPKRTRFDNSRVPYRASALYSESGQPSNTIPRQERRPRRNFQQGQEPRQQETTYKQEFGQRRGNNRQEPWQRPRGPGQ